MIWFEAHIAVVISVALTLFSAVIVLQQRRTPQSTVAWLSFFLLAPYLALPLFLALGFRKSRSTFTAVRFHPVKEAPVPVNEMDSLFAHYGIPPSSEGNAVHFIADGAECWDETLRIVRTATQTLDITFYLVANDGVGRSFVEALTERVRAGVRVRLIIDRLGGFVRPGRALREFRQAGGLLHDFSPLIQMPAKGHLNLRNHRKMIIADGARVLSGGRNIGAEYLGPGPGDHRWIDLSYALAGPVVQSFVDVFESDWAATGRDDTKTEVCIAHHGAAQVQLVPSGPDMVDDPMHDGLVRAIHASQDRVWVVTPYFLPTDHLWHALMIAARRGVDVRILVPEKSNQYTADFARGAYLRGLETAGCRILRFQAGMNHAKAWVIDDTAAVGSANFDVRSMLLNFEMMLFLYDDKSVGQMADWVCRFVPECQTGAPSAGLVRRLVEGVFRLGAPIL
ncbi:phospholipase D-like domain-containing protein [Puniceibacterium sediminis]|uniref:Phospholipase D n=1 Tax=Puniceibacterium sediminis TaxID=1608407 RepID=A0A238W0T8_9RHOB|nr:phospholipase D-like domain-containing protein [Puniceibacterium sediminis]SNR40126.1 cardiolipin synthetase 2 [Puniceibacterium sediminis]